LVAQNKTEQERIRAEQMLAIKQAELDNEILMKEEAEKVRQAMDKETADFNEEQLKNAEKHEQDMEKIREEAEAKHRQTLLSIANHSETAMTTLFSKNLTAREKKQQIYKQVMTQIQGQITNAFIASMAKQKTLAVQSSMVQIEAAKPPIAAGFFKAYAGLPYVGQAIAIGLIAAAFAFIDRLVKFNKGGVVPGIGNMDTVPALLTPGERVLTKAQNKAFELGGMGDNNINIHINGTFLDANENKWRDLFNNKLLPQMERFTMLRPSGILNRRRGART
jgi:hypothetical protein